MNLRLLILTSVFSVYSVVPIFAAPRPNVLVILADDLGYSDLGCYGGEVPTPNIDRLAKGGARFSAFYNSARCCPSRASLITGLHPHEAGIGSFAQGKPTAGWGPAYTGHLLDDTATLAEILGDAGYSTWMVGKWHMGIPGPIKRGFQNYFGYKNFLAHSENQWDPEKYVRLPEGKKPELSYPNENFFVTDVFTDYALEFLKQARNQKDNPFFLYLAHSSPHFPVQAPKESIDRHVDTYRRGWDVLRTERFERQKKSGLVPADATLPPLSEVPVDRDDIANGYSGKPNPAWDSLATDRREDLARRGATFAAMVEHVDQGIGRILADLEKNGDLDNTLIFFTSDNGACYEWGPFGFDGKSRKGLTTLHKGAELDRIGQADTHHSYGSAWANLGNTPLNMYKHFCHEGGITSPMIAHWPAGIKARPGFIADPAHIMDIVPTVCEATGVPYPETRGEIDIQPVSGTSLLPVLRGTPLSERPLAFEHQQARGLRKGDWKLVWGKRQPDQVRWELYNLADDRSEQNDLAATHPEKLQQMILEWTIWARRVGAEPFQHTDAGDITPRGGSENSPVAKRPLTVYCKFEAGADRDGVLLAHGGREHGYALHLVAGKPAFDVRVNGKVTRVSGPKRVNGRTKVTATLDKKSITLSVNGEQVAEKPSPGLIPKQPKDDLSIGKDILSAAGNYEAPNPFDGTIHEFEVTTSSESTAPPSVLGSSSSSPSSAPSWSAEKANTWYASIGWPVGANFVPSTAINQLEMWQADTFDPETIDRELGWAAAIGMNTMRTFLHDIPWKTDPEGYAKRIDRYLEIADKHGIRTMFVFFDGVWHPYPKAGKQPAPTPGVHNSGWVQSPGRDILGDPKRQDELKPFVQGILRRYKDDKRVLIWDLFNEPDNPNRSSYGDAGTKQELDHPTKTKRAMELLDKTVTWSREINPSQPLTIGLWSGDYLGKPNDFHKLCLDHSDVVSFHSYGGPAHTLKLTEGLGKLGRPVLCTEYMSRGSNSKFSNVLPIFHQHRAGAYNWGLVNGKSQTIYPWSSWQKPFAAEPDIWFHDIFRKDGVPYLKEETTVIRKLTSNPPKP